MSITHPTAIRSSKATVVLTAVDVGSGPGQCVLKSGANEVSTIPLNKPSFIQSGATLTLDNSPVPQDPSATGNASNVSSVEFQDSDANVVFTGGNITGVGGGGDVELSKNPIAASDIVQLASFTYTAAP